MTVDPAVRITVLTDNARGEPGLRSQWGLSFWIETPQARVLLDCGANDAFLRNARRLSVPLEDADAVVLSHGHFDHGGGLAKVAEVVPRAPLVLHPGALVPRFERTKAERARPTGLPQTSLEVLRHASDRIVWASEPVRVAPGVWATGPVPRHHPLEEAERTFFLDTSFTVRDHVVDNQAMWVETEGGLVVFSGCAHAGIVNTIEHVRAAAASGDGSERPPRVRAVLGGFHMLQARKDRLAATVDYVAGLHLELCAPCHCTGKRATTLLHERLGDVFVEIATGSCLTLA